MEPFHPASQVKELSEIKTFSWSNNTLLYTVNVKYYFKKEGALIKFSEKKSVYNLCSAQDLTSELSLYTGVIISKLSPKHGGSVQIFPDKQTNTPHDC